MGGLRMEKLRFTNPSEEYWEQLVSYREEFINNNDSMDGCGPLKRFSDSYKYLAEVEKYKNKDTVPEGKVMATQFLCVREHDDRLVGMIQIRHYLTDYLEKYIGHIGYSVRPSERKKGYGTWILKEALNHCKELGIDKVILCCDKNNKGSKKIIEKNGGVFMEEIFNPQEGDYVLKYMICSR